MNTNLSRAHIDLLETVLSADLTESESINLAISIRRVAAGEISTAELWEFVHNCDAPTREEAFSRLATYKPKCVSNTINNVFA